MTSVSVVIPCYNYGHFLEEAVSSVLDQEGVEVGVLVIDDASPDDSAEVARKIAARDPRVAVAVHSNNRGHIATYNEGLLEWADGDYCVLLSADDQLTPGALKRATDVLDLHPSVGFVYGKGLHFRHGTPLPEARTRPRGWSVWSGEEWLERQFRRHGSTGISSPEVVVRTSLQKRVGGYDPRLPHAGDHEMWARLAANADVAHLNGVDQAYYREHAKNMSGSYDQVMDFQQRRLAFEVVFDDHAKNFADPRHLSDLVHRQLAWQALLIAARAYDRGRTAQTPVDGLVEFALDCWPEARKFTIYRTLRVRRRIGPQGMPYLQPFVLSPVARKAQWAWWQQSWKYGPRGI